MSEIPLLSVQNISKRYGDLVVLEDVSLEVGECETVAIIGHSGCGKTTLLHIICALLNADDGLVLLDGASHTTPTKDALMLFQSFDQLQPWRTVLKNVMYPLLATKTVKDRAVAKELALKRIADVGLQDFAATYPHTLSGGMKQRVAVARALALRPRVLLMDEPFAALDNITRGKLQALTRRVCGKYGISAILVTHSVEEALLMADRIIVMDKNPGRIGKVFENPEKVAQEPSARAALSSEIMELLEAQEPMAMR